MHAHPDDSATAAPTIPTPQCALPQSDRQFVHPAPRHWSKQDHQRRGRRTRRPESEWSRVRGHHRIQCPTRAVRFRKGDHSSPTSEVPPKRRVTVQADQHGHSVHTDHRFRLRRVACKKRAGLLALPTPNVSRRENANLGAIGFEAVPECRIEESPKSIGRDLQAVSHGSEKLPINAVHLGLLACSISVRCSKAAIYLPVGSCMCTPEPPARRGLRRLVTRLAYRD